MDHHNILGEIVFVGTPSLQIMRFVRRVGGSSSLRSSPAFARSVG